MWWQRCFSFRYFFLRCFFTNLAAKNIFANKLHTFILKCGIILGPFSLKRKEKRRSKSSENDASIHNTLGIWIRIVFIISDERSHGNTTNKCVLCWLLKNGNAFCVLAFLNAIASFWIVAEYASNGMYPTIPTPFHHIWAWKQCASREWLLIK